MQTLRLSKVSSPFLSVGLQYGGFFFFSCFFIYIPTHGHLTGYGIIQCRIQIGLVLSHGRLILVALQFFRWKKSLHPVDLFVRTAPHSMPTVGEMAVPFTFEMFAVVHLFVTECVDRVWCLYVASLLPLLNAHLKICLGSLASSGQPFQSANKQELSSWLTSRCLKSMNEHAMKSIIDWLHAGIWTCFEIHHWLYREFWTHLDIPQ